MGSSCGCVSPPERSGGDMAELNDEKLANAVLYVLRECPVRPGVTGLLKMLYFADYEHYRKHLRPITGAQYVALPNGPVLNNYREYFKRLVKEGYLEQSTVPVPGAAHPKLEYEARM